MHEVTRNLHSLRYAIRTGARRCSISHQLIYGTLIKNPGNKTFIPAFTLISIHFGVSSSVFIANVFGLQSEQMIEH